MQKADQADNKSSRNRGEAFVSSSLPRGNTFTCGSEPARDGAGPGQ